MKHKFDSCIIIVKFTSHLPNTKSKTIKAINVITVDMYIDMYIIYNKGPINNVAISYTKMGRKVLRKHIILFVPDVNIYIWVIEVRYSKNM